MVGYLNGAPMDWVLSGSPLTAFVVEMVKWCMMLGIALWLSLAQVAAWRRKASGRAREEVVV